MKDLFRLELEMEQKMCSICKKSSSEYWNMQSQIRFKYFEDILKMKETVYNLLMKGNLSINKLEELDNGFDIYFRTNSDMNKVSSLFSNFLITEKRSKKLMGKDQLLSKDVYRYFQCITLINVRVNDHVAIKGEKYYIKAINKGGLLVLRGLEKGEKKVISYSMIEDYFQLLDKEDTV
jgi:NMD protein affecting ribosome stability and mRNA decay